MYTLVVLVTLLSGDLNSYVDPIAYASRQECVEKIQPVPVSEMEQLEIEKVEAECVIVGAEDA